MKKLFAILLTLALVLSMGTMALAASDGVITIDNAIVGVTYEIYKMFDFTPVSENSSQGRYRVVAEWENFLKSDEAKKYLSVNDETGTIEWVGSEEETRKAEFAKLAVSYAVTNHIDATKSKKATSSTVEFGSLDLGYYAINTTLGTVCILTNTNSSIKVVEKNTVPEIEKYVQEDSEESNTDGGWGKVNDAAIGETVNFKSEITVGKGSQGFVMHDTMATGLNFGSTVSVTDKNGTVASENYTLKTTGTCGCTFEIVFEDSYIATLSQEDVITVTYSAVLTDEAEIATGIANSVYLAYGENSSLQTQPKTTKTYTWKMDVFKWTKEGQTEKALAGATFELRTSKTDENSKIKFTKVENAEVPTYKVDSSGSASITTDASGAFEIVGLDSGTYYLYETAAPDGYNKLSEPKTVEISATYDDTAISADYMINGAAPATIKVENKTGSLLPETGGIGTTIFYVVGGLMMLAAVVLLVSKKRMSSFA